MKTEILVRECPWKKQLILSWKSPGVLSESFYFSHQSQSLSLLVSTSLLLFLSVFVCQCFNLISVFLCVNHFCLSLFLSYSTFCFETGSVSCSLCFCFLFVCPNLCLTLFLCCILSLLFWSQGYVFKLMAYMPISIDLLRLFLLINFLLVDSHCPGVFWLVWSCLCMHPEINI